jgi:GxxExxY protein
MIHHQGHQGHQGGGASAAAPAVLPESVDVVGKAIVDSAFKVHSALGPGLLESVYEACLLHELTARGLAARKQVTLPVQYGDLRIDAGLRLDLLVDESVIVEVKAVDALAQVHTAQVLTYLKLSGFRLGYLINFNVTRIRDGIRRFAH